VIPTETRTRGGGGATGEAAEVMPHIGRWVSERRQIGAPADLARNSTLVAGPAAIVNKLR